MLTFQALENPQSVARMLVRLEFRAQQIYGPSFGRGNIQRITGAGYVVTLMAQELHRASQSQLDLMHFARRVYNFNVSRANTAFCVRLDASTQRVGRYSAEPYD